MLTVGLKLTRNWALPGARQRTLARDVGEGSGDVLSVRCGRVRDSGFPGRRQQRAEAWR